MTRPHGRPAATLLLGALLAVGAVLPLAAQQTSGTIAGTITDKQGAVVVGAKLTLTDQQQGTAREGVSDAQGSFVFTPLQPSTYTLTVTAPGFSTFSQRDITLYAADRLGLPAIVLAVGSVTETVVVQAAAVQLQAVSAERSGVVTGLQTVELALNGRNFLGLLRTVPGVNADTNNVNGRRVDQNNLSMDGVTTMDTGNNGTGLIQLNVDAIAEFKVLTNSQQAEYGRTAGAQITVVTKSGSRDFHGTGYYFRRHDSLNANTWRNNVDGRPRPLYRFNTYGFNVGGPVLLPFTQFNRQRDKLFFFVSGEYDRRLNAVDPRNLTVPTALERRGDFSQTRESNGAPVIIRDPLTNAPFPGNVIPQSRWHPDGPRILAFFPEPNITGQPNYNYTSQISGQDNLNQHIVRLDYNLNERWRVFGRWIGNVRPRASVYGDLNSTNTIGIGQGFDLTGRAAALMANVTTILNPTLTNEFVVGRSRNQLVTIPLDDAYTRSRAGLTFAPLFPQADALQYVPNFTFGGVPNAPSSNFRGLPYFNQNPTLDLTDNVAKVFSGHTVKAGIFYTKTAKDQVANNPVNGILSFDRDTQNPGDTNWAYANALLGNFRSFSQSDTWPTGEYRFHNLEWYVQDNWRVTRSFTLDYGIRFSYIQPQYEQNNLIASFNPALYDARQRVALYQRARNAAGQVAARNPITGEFAPPVLIGAIVPGSGNIDNGIAIPGLNGYPRGGIQDRGIHYGPRLGFAWQLGAKTVLRSGAGIFYDRIQGNQTFSLLSNPPTTRTPQVFFGNLSTLASGAQNFFPVDVRGNAPDGHVPTTYNWNLSIQRELPGAVLLDVAYVGSASNHLLYQTMLNEPAYGSAWRPEFQDPTVATPRFDGTTTLPVNFLRPYAGYGTVRVQSFGANSNYNALQVSANRRLSRGLQFGLAYAWSKTLGTSDSNTDDAHPTDLRGADYGLLPFDRTHNLVVNYIWDVPRLARGLLNNQLGRLVLNRWTFSGITSVTSGAPDTLSYSIQGVSGPELNRRITGSETNGPRVVILADPTLEGGERTYDRFINTSVFAPALRGSTGNDSGIRPVRRPGLHNWDLSLFKDLPLGGREGRYVQLRLETFNAFNQTQFSDFNRSIVFDNAGRVTNLPSTLGGGGGRFGFGALNTSRAARIVQLAAKFYF